MSASKIPTAKFEKELKSINFVDDTFFINDLDIEGIDLIESMVSFEQLENAHLFPRDPEFDRNIYEKDIFD